MNSRNFTPRQVDDMVELYGDDEPLKAIAKRFRCSPNTVKRYLLERGVAMRPAVRLKQHDPALDKAMARAYVEGRSQREVAAQFATSKYLVHAALLRVGVKIRGKVESWEVRRPVRVHGRGLYGASHDVRMAMMELAEERGLTVMQTATIAQRVGTTTSGARRSLQRLEARGYVTRAATAHGWRLVR